MLLPTFAAASVLLFALALFLQARGRAREKAQLARRLSSLGRDTPTEVGAIELWQEKRHSDIQTLHEILNKISVTDDLERLARHAGLRLRVGDIVLRMGLTGMAAAFIAFMVQGSLWPALGAFVAGGPVLGMLYLKRRREKRRGTVMTQLPDTLEMIRSSLQAGHSFSQALEVVAEEAPEPLAGEFRQVLDELRLGHNMKTALQGIYDRTGIQDLRFFMVAVLLNREIGGNLSEIIDSVSGTMRERFKLKAQVRALTAQGRFSALILTGLSPSLMLALSILNPDYLSPLFTTKIGHVMLVYCVASTAFGYYLMRKIVDIKVIRTD